MKTVAFFLIGIVAALFLANTAGAEDDTNGLYTPPTLVTLPEQWDQTTHEAHGLTEFSHTSEQGSVSVMCGFGTCGVLLIPTATCIPGSQVPMLINSAETSGVVKGQCAISIDSRIVLNGGPKTDALFLQQIKLGVELKVAIADHFGTISVLDLPSAGLWNSLKLLIEEASPESSDENKHDA